MHGLVATTLLLVGFAVPAAAHPHVFIDTAFDLVFDEAGRLSAVDVEWTYDELYTLLMVEESDLDADGDGVPEQDRLDAFAGGDVDWAAGFPGDFTLTLDGEAIPLPRPKSHTASWRDGRFVTTHRHALSRPIGVDGRTLVARSYDPSYFVAYDVPGMPEVVGRETCLLAREAADSAAAQRKYGDTLAELDMSADPFAVVDLPDIGILFADAFVISCDAPS